MKVAILADPLDNQNAGVHVYTREMISSLIENNSKHEILLIRQNFDPNLKGVKQIIVPARKFPPGAASMRLFFTIPKILRREKVDIVIEPAHFGPFNLPKKIKRVTVIHDLTPILFPQLHRWHSQILQRVFLKGILKNAHLILTNSENTKKDVEKTYPETQGKTVMIYPGISRNIRFENTNLLENYGIKKPYFLSVGTIEPRKNHLLILETFTEFREKNSALTQLVITGGRGWKSEAFYKALESNPYAKDIILTGFVPDNHLPILNREALAMIYPSKYEGFGLPVLEAMAWGTIPITSSNSSLPEVGGDSAFYLKNEDSSELLKMMENTASLTPEQRKNRIDALKEHAFKFSWVHFGKILWKSLEKI